MTTSVRRRSPKFAVKGEFHRALDARVDDYFDESGRDRLDAPRMYLKSAIILAWLAGSYAGLEFFASGWFSALLFSTSLGLRWPARGWQSCTMAPTKRTRKTGQSIDSGE